MRYAIGAAVLVLLATLVRADASGQVPFFDPCAGVVVEDAEPGAASAVTFTWGVGVGDNCISERGIHDREQYAIERLVQFIPPEWGVKADADMPDGTVVGDIDAQFTLGLLNNPCTFDVDVEFTLYEGTTNRADVVASLPAGSADRLRPLRLDADQNEIPDGADLWPEFLNEVFIEAGADLSKLRARYFSASQLPAANNLTTVAQMLVFEPGAYISTQLLIDPRLGYPVVVILQDPTSPGSSEDFVSDVCIPMSAQVTLDGPLTNPDARTYPFTTYFMARPDADGDGFENALDTCPLDANVGDSRTFPDPGDNDMPGDGIDESCDPDPDAGQGTSDPGVALSDEDGDGWMNRADNCPLVSNDDQRDDDRDAIGEPCDPHPYFVDGEVVDECVIAPVAIGDGGTGYYPSPQYFLPCSSDFWGMTGDVDCDLDVDLTDFLFALRHVAGIEDAACIGQAPRQACGDLTRSDLLGFIAYLTDLGPLSYGCPTL